MNKFSGITSDISDYPAEIQRILDKPDWRCLAKEIIYYLSIALILITSFILAITLTKISLKL